MTKLNFLDVNVEDLSNKEMKDMIKDYIDSTGDRVKGYHDFNKSDLQNKIIEIYADFIVEDDDISEIVSENKEEIKEEKPKKKVSENKSKFIYVVKNPEGEIVEKFSKLKDVFNYAEMNGICTRGWVSLSIERNIPVLIGLGRDKEISEDFVPRTTKKYNGNYWKFEKETIGEEE